jgi:hypothetical protein
MSGCNRNIRAPLACARTSPHVDKIIQWIATSYIPGANYGSFQLRSVKAQPASPKFHRAVAWLSLASLALWLEPTQN